MDVGISEELEMDWTSCNTCDGILSSGPPPALFMPPPPRPPFLDDLEEGDCDLCLWSEEKLTLESQFNTADITSSNIWVPLLVVVALTSAVLGAIGMICVLKCKRVKGCFRAVVVPGWCSRVYCKLFTQTSADINPSRKVYTRNKVVDWPPDFWRARDVISATSQVSEENSYSEGPYHVTDSNSVLYAELNTSYGCHVTSNNTYSEILPANLGQYENSAFPFRAPSSVYSSVYNCRTLSVLQREIVVPPLTPHMNQTCHSHILPTKKSRPLPSVPVVPLPDDCQYL